MTDLPVLQIVGAVVLGALLLGVGTWYGRATAPPPDRRAPPDTDSVEVKEPDRSLSAIWPDRLVVYDTIRTDSLVRDTMWLPRGYEVAGCFQGEPLRRETSVLGPDTYTTTYFDPSARRYKQKSYRWGRPTWALWPEVEIRTTPAGLQASGLVSLRYRKVTLFAGYTTLAGERGFTAGLAVRPFTLTW